jgi:hypothetical protein
MAEPCVPKVTCDVKELTWEQLVRMLIQISQAGCPAVNTVKNLPA